MNPNCYLFQELANNADAFTFPFPGLPNGAGNYHTTQYMNNNHEQSNRNFNKRSYGKNNSFNRGVKKVKTENFIDFCDVCDRGFTTIEKKHEHFSQHVKCQETGCNFEAHFKIVEIHRRNLHGPNGRKIKLETTEDINKWREERRRNFPTHDRVQQKQAEENEKFEAGAVLQQQSFGKFRSTNRGRGGKRFRGNRGNYHGTTNNSPTTENHNTATLQQTYVPENPMDLLTEHEAKSCADGSDGEQTKEQNVNFTGSVLGGLGQLMSNYDSDDTSDNEHNNIPPKPCVLQDEDQTSQHYHKKSSENSMDVMRLPPIKRPSHQARGKSNHKPTYQSRLARPSLLRKLLEPEMRRERNDILQCVRYIVSNNFFVDQVPAL